MKKIYCDKCKKEINKKENSLCLSFFGLRGSNNLDLSDLCEKCAEKFSKVVNKFIKSK